MAVKKTQTTQNTAPKSNLGKTAKWGTVGWSFLLLGGLAHMLPVQMAPLLAWSWYGVSVQMAVGVVSVILALYFLLGE